MKNYTLNDLEKYIGKQVYIFIPEYCGDEYWGTIDAYPSYVSSGIVHGFYIHKIGKELKITLIYINDKNKMKEEYDIKNGNIFLDKKLEKPILTI